MGKQDKITIDKKLLRFYLSKAYFSGKFADQGTPVGASEEFKLEVHNGIIEALLKEINEHLLKNSNE